MDVLNFLNPQSSDKRTIRQLVCRSLDVLGVDDAESLMRRRPSEVCQRHTLCRGSMYNVAFEDVSSVVIIRLSISADAVS
jgi:hypothetical protein